MGIKRSYSQFLFILAILCPLCIAEGLDKTKYITADEITTNMTAYCLTVYQGTNIEKFPLKIISVVKNFETGRDIIFVMGTDERFKHTGAVAGCSGSPVFINDRLAGALAMGWSLSKDPLYGVTPIEEMMRAGVEKKSENFGGLDKNLIDFSKPLNFGELNKVYFEALKKNQTTNVGNYKYLSVPLAISMPQRTFKAGAEYFDAAGFMPVSSPAKGGIELNVPNKFERGSVLAVSLLSGDISIAGVGTVTEVVDDKVYGFGHSMLGRGETEMPISNGYIHTIVASIMTSFKLGQAGEVIGTMTNDISTAVYGTTSKMPSMIPLTIKIDRFNDILRTYNCYAAKDRHITPALSAFTIAGAIIMIDELPDDFVIDSRIEINVEGYEPIISNGIASGSSPVEIANNLAAPLFAIMNNPFKKMSINSIDFQAKIENKSIISTVEEITISKTKVKPSEIVEITVQTREYLGQQEMFTFRVKIPDNIANGQYTINIGGGDEYAKFVVQNKPHNYTAIDANSLIAAIRNSMAFERTGLYLIMPLPPKGIVLDRKELSSLPFTKAIPLTDPRRTISVQPNTDWLEMKNNSKRIFINNKQINLTVEK